ncbi:MAG: hypothetical protein PHP13_05915 [Methanomicrobium sp.]|nr:hypothetical protein [Methanomicrobium sp.]
MSMPRYLKLTQKELDELVNNPKCTLAHKMVIAGRIERGEWEITDKADDAKPDDSKPENNKKEQ